jgi:hypothetical protein
MACLLKKIAAYRVTSRRARGGLPIRRGRLAVAHNRRYEICSWPRPVYMGQIPILSNISWKSGRFPVLIHPERHPATPRGARADMTNSEESILNLTTIFMTLAGVAAGLLAGLLISNWRARQKASSGLRVPVKWPLVPRGLVTTSENEVWSWLRNVFHDHMVMVKVPVLRFTIPTDRERHKSAQWLEMLGAVYTTFTVCTADGTVVGCVDVPGKRGLGQANRELKEALLSDCNIAYTVVRSNSLPQPDAMRAAFLGEIANEFTTEPQQVYSEDTQFSAEVMNFTKEKMRAAKESAQRQINKQAQDAGGRPQHSGHGSLVAEANNSRFPTEWENSFIGEMDTRPAKLE